MGADAGRVVLSGASAGGHIASLLMMQAYRDNIKVVAMVLFYPALDPGDLTGVTARWPFNVKMLPYLTWSAV